MHNRHSGFFRVWAVSICVCLFARAENPATKSSDVTARGGQIRGIVVSEDGKPCPGAWIMTDSGVITETGADGAFALNGLSDGGYAIRIVADGCSDSIVPKIAVKEGETPVARVVLTSDPANSSVLVTGRVSDADTGEKLAAFFEILNRNTPVRWFDIDGRSYGGRTDVPAKVWHQKNKRYWTLGDFAFSAQPGELQVRVWVDGFTPVTVRRTLKSGVKEHLDLAMRRLFDPASAGWFKGDFHAHGVHGERLYTVNIPYMAFILRAEGYRWFYLSQAFSNDGMAIDPFASARAESGTDLFLALNAEYPKTYGGHVGSVGIGPPRNPLPYPRYSNTEVIKRDIVDQGGAAVPVHPLTGHMKSRELPFLILGAPELICGFDFYTGWTERLEKTWTMFLNRGYRFCRTATSDTAFDLGRTPGTMGATFIHPDGGRLTRETIVEAFKAGRTVVSWQSALLTFTIDQAVCGEVFPADGRSHNASLALYHTPGIQARIDVMRNGELFRQFSAAIPPTGKVDFEFALTEREKAWYTALCFADSSSGRMIAATSPFYFGDWGVPAPVFAEVEARVFDADTKEPLSATLALIDPGEANAVFHTEENGVLHLKARVFQRLKASVSGYADRENGILDTKAVNEFISSVSEEDLQLWETYDEKARGILQTLTIDFPMKRR